MKRRAAMGTAVLFALSALACGGGEEAPEQQSPQGQQQAPAAQQDQQLDVSDEELRAFAQANEQLQQVAEDARADMQDAEGQQQAQQVRDDFRDELTRIVREAGLDTARYNEIRSAVQSDPDLRNRFLEIQRERQQ